MLHLWDRDSLLDRARDTLARLARKKVGGTALSDVLLGVALTDLAWEEEHPRTGLTLAAMGEMCSINSGDIVTVVLNPLGKEASLSRIGSTVVIRHPAVRNALIDTMDEETENRVARILGAAGGRLRRRRSSADDFGPLTRLPRRLTGALALQVGEAAMTASGLLESRVTYLATCRDQKSSHGITYARGLSDHVAEFPDFRSAVRGFLVEWAAHELSVGEARKAAALCAYSLSDSQPGYASARQVEYGLTQLIVSARRMQDVRLRREIVGTSASLLALLPVNTDLPEVVGRPGGAATSLRRHIYAFKVATHPLGRVMRAEVWSFQQLLKDISAARRAGLS